MSIHPQWCKHIFFEKDKLYEVRKRAPLLKPPYKVYVYCTLKGPMLSGKTTKDIINGLVIGEFTCIKNLEETPPWRDKEQGTCLTARDLAWYSEGKNLIYMKINEPKLFNRPMELKEFGINRPPQSFQYVEELKNG